MIAIILTAIIGIKENKLERHHVVPLEVNGPDTNDNIVVVVVPLIRVKKF